MLFDKNKYYELSEQIRERIVKCYIIYIIFFTIVGLIISYIVPIFDTTIVKILIIFSFVLFGLLLAGEKTIKIQIEEQEMKWKLDIYDIINKMQMK